MVFGFGINDAGRPVSITKNGRLVWRCPYYIKWQNMLKRCYSRTSKIDDPTYADCVVDPEWQHFSSFIKWVDEQPNRDWVNCHLDKDLLVKGNKVYSPNTVVFISRVVNNFINTSDATCGYYWVDHAKSFRAKCANPLSKNQDSHLGYFKTELEAKTAWLKAKCQYAHKLAELQEDPRVVQALIERYK